MNMDRVAKAFDQWMDDYLHNPDAFESMTKTALQHLKERQEGKEPSYGQISAATFGAYYDGLK